MKLKETLSWIRTKIQAELFPYLEEEFTDPITKKQKQLIEILEIVEVERYVLSSLYQWMGRKPKDRRAIARAFVLKAVYNMATTKDLIELLNTAPNLRKICGISGRKDIASESTFSRAFAEFAKNGLGERVHEALLEEYLSDELIGHISRDSTAIEGNEKPKKKDKKDKKDTEPKKRGRPRKGEERQDKAEEKRINKQVAQSPHEALKEIPIQCDVGTKRNAKGYKETWIGYKFHIDATDSGFPVTTILTSASLHDSQVAIPMMKITTEKVTYLYDLMDSAYDAAPIYEVSQKLQHVPIIDKNPRRGSVIPMSPAEALRYNERSSVERVNGRLKEDFGGNNIKVRGDKKVKLHLMFGIIALFADQLIRLIL
ncbi:MAG: transposase [Oligoflexia bacterium]|nr:transposase [Oligoflexia bacterium]MCP5003080.1 transposase [Planctomycetota bacterium]